MPEKTRKRRKKKPIKRLTSDRFNWVLVVSVVFHAVIVLGVSFVMPSVAGNRDFSPPLKITLVNTLTNEQNEEAEILAQANSIGEQDPSALAIAAAAAASGKKVEEIERILIEERARATFNTEENQLVEEQDTGGNKDQLIRSIDLAFLNSQAKPRERFVSADAKASEIAPYLENWRSLVERVGNLNYPDAAKRNDISGELIMDVTIRSDGSVDAVRILRSSGHKILDDGAERIVHIAAPFDSFSDSMQKEYDTLHIIRTWRFSQNTLRDATK